MRDASLLSPDGARLEPGFASFGDPMDISPRPATDQPHQQQSSEWNSQSAVSTSDQMSNHAFPRLPSARDLRALSSAPGYVKPEGKGSLGLQTRGTNYRPASGFSPKDRTSLRRAQLKRIPIGMQVKLPNPTRPVAVGVNRPFRPSSLSSNSYKRQAMNVSFANSSLRFNHLHSRPALNFSTVNRQLTSTNPATGAFAGAGQAADEIAAKSASRNTTAPTTATYQVSEASHGNLPLQRMRFNEEESNDIDIRRPSSYVSPKYRKFTQRGLDSSPPSSTHLSQHAAPANDDSHSSSPQPPTAPTTSSNLTSPFKLNFAASKSRPIFGASESKHTETWDDMKEFDEAFREQGITPLMQEPPKQNPPHQDPSQKDPKTSPYLMPGSWPEDPLDFSESTKAGSHLPSQGPGLLGDHGSLISGVLDASPELVPTTQQPIGTQGPPSFSQNAEVSQAQCPEAVQEEQPQPSFSWCDQLHRIYNNSWGATQSVVTTAIALADSFKRRAVAIFEDRRPASRRPSTHTSSSPTRANLRSFPEEQRRRLKSNQWRKDRGFPTVEEYPFPQLFFGAPQSPSTTAPVSKVEPSPKSDTLPTPDTSENKVSKESIIRNKRPGRRTVSTLVKDSKRHSARSGVYKKSMAQMRPSKRSLARTRLDCLSHAVDNGEVALDEIPAAKKEPVTTAHKHKKFVDPLVNFKGSHNNFFRKPKHVTRKKVRFDLQSTQADPSLVGHHLHPRLPRVTVEEPSLEEKENEPPKSNIKAKREDFDPGLHSWLQSEHPFGRPVSAVRLFAPHLKSLPPGRTESIYAAEWREIEEEEKRLLRPQLPARIRPEGPAVRPLPRKWETRLAEAKALPNNRQVATTLSGDPLTKRDLATCYTPMAWLNDEIINAYLALLVDYLRRAHGNAGRNDKPRFHAFNSFFFSNLRDKGYASVCRWARRAKIGGESLLDVDTVYIPVHDTAHWTLMVVKPTSRSIEHFDSLGSPSAHHVAKVKEWLRGELSARYVDEEWTVASSTSPQQDNGSDCGAFLLSTAKAVAIGLEPLSYGTKDIPLLRRKIVAELMAGGLDGDFNPAGGKGKVLM